MKYIMTGMIALIMSVTTYGQSIVNKTVKSTGKEPVCYIDSVRYERIYLFDPQKIVSLYVEKGGTDSSSATSGKIFIKTKNPKEFNFQTLEEAAKLEKDLSQDVLFMIDGKIIDNISGLKIDASYVLRSEIINVNDIGYLHQTTPLKIVNIITRSVENMKETNKLIIRGQSK